MKTLFTAVLVLWLVVVFLLGAAGTFERPGTPPIPILIGAVGPLVVFLAAYWGSARFRAFVLAIDLPLATAVQAWRAGGLGFLALYVHGVLPGVFAWPAGLATSRSASARRGSLLPSSADAALRATASSCSGTCSASSTLSSRLASEG
jgi:hypothetical protein